jgi:uncharacterized protein (TIGR03437 family)
MFSRIVLISFLLLCAVVAPVSAQAIPLPPAALGVPYSFDLGAGFNAIPPIPGLDFSFSFSLAAGSLPPGISLTPSGLFSGTPTATGDFPFTINFHFHLAFEGQVYDLDLPLAVSLNVTGMPSGVAVTVAPAALTFNFVQGASASATQSLAISNRSKTPLTFSASPSAKWLSVSPTSGPVGPFSATSLAVTANPSGLAEGIYTGSVSVSVAPTGENLDVLVTVTISGSQAELALSQSGERFQAVAGGASPASQSIAVLSGSGGAINWTASASTTSGGSSWLSVSPASGRSTSSSSSSTKVSVNPAGLQPGDYYGLVQFSADGAANSPQSVQVVFSVLPADAALPAAVQPTGAVFVGVAGGANPAARTITISNPSNRALMFSTAIFVTNGTNWFTVQPAGGAVAAGQTASFDIQPAINALPVGVYRGEVTLRFTGLLPEDSSIRRIVVLAVVVGSPPSGSSPQANAPGPQAGCTPTQLLPVSTQLGAGFATPASWPVALEALVVDDCGNLMTSGSVVTSFSSGDAPVVLTSLHDGRWSGTWVPHAVVPQVTVMLAAQETEPAIQGTVQIGGSSQANPTVPVVSSGGAVSAASFAGNQPLAPGSFAAIFGSNLALGTNVAPSLPFLPKLGGTQAFLGGRPLAMYYTRGDVVIAVVPYDVPLNTTQQLVIQQGSSLSSPERVNIAAAQPAIFTANSSGKGPGAITNAQNVLVTSGNPVRAGDVVVIYCAGLGALDSPITAGVAAPLDKLLNTVNPVSVSIGGNPAMVLFGGLTPGSAGLYQVNAIVPDGVTADPNTPLFITVAGQQSNTVTLAVAK